MAADKVFDTAELVEWVLLELDFKDILKAKAITRKIKAVIEGSPKIKRKLFLAADGDPILPLPPSKGIDKYPGYQTPILMALPQDIVPLFERREADTDDEEVQPRIWAYVENTSASVWDRFDNVYRNCFAWYRNRMHNPTDHLKLPLAYRPMFLTQPPVTALLLEPGAITIYDKTGITLGMIADAFAQIGKDWDRYMKFMYNDPDLDSEDQDKWYEEQRTDWVRASFRIVSEVEVEDGAG